MRTNTDIKVEAEHPQDPANTRIINEWVSYDIDSNMMTGADSFELALIPTQDMRRYFSHAGHVVRIYYGDDLQMTGIVDSISGQSTGSEVSLQISGRDFGGLLVDDTPPMISYANRTIKELIQLYIQNHSVYITRVDVDNAVNRKIITGKIKTSKTGKKSTVYTPINNERDFETRTKPNDKIWSLIVSQAKKVGAHAWMSASGSIVVSRPNYQIDPDIYGKGIWDTVDAEGNPTGSNYVSLNRDPSIADRSSHYTVVGQGTPKISALGADLAEKYAAAIDPSPAFFIKDAQALTGRLQKTDIDSVRNVKDTSMVRRIARSKMEHGAVSGYSMSCALPFHRPGEGAPIYSVDTMINVSSQIWGIWKPHYIYGRKLSNNASAGRTAVLSLWPPEIWLPTGGTDAMNDQKYLAAKSQQIDW